MNKNAILTKKNYFNWKNYQDVLNTERKNFKEILSINKRDFIITIILSTCIFSVLFCKLSFLFITKLFNIAIYFLLLTNEN